MSETRKATKPLCGFHDRCSPSEPYCGQTPCAYHEAVVRVAEQTLRDHAPHLLVATPPTPDRAAVREALVGVFTHFPYTPELMLAAHRLVHALGIPVDSEAERIADALLRPAPLPADVQAAVEHHRRMLTMASSAGMCREDIEVSCKELLAHLTREAR